MVVTINLGEQSLLRFIKRHKGFVACCKANSGEQKERGKKGEELHRESFFCTCI
jgi:hypothetical protein